MKTIFSCFFSLIVFGTNYKIITRKQRDTSFICEHSKKSMDTELVLNLWLGDLNNHYLFLCTEKYFNW
jgi:hypothetical protein